VVRDHDPGPEAATRLVVRELEGLRRDRVALRVEADLAADADAAAGALEEAPIVGVHGHVADARDPEHGPVLTVPAPAEADPEACMRHGAHDEPLVLGGRADERPVMALVHGDGGHGRGGEGADDDQWKCSAHLCG
jgi:hypothetical protein